MINNQPIEQTEVLEGDLIPCVKKCRCVEKKPTSEKWVQMEYVRCDRCQKWIPIRWILINEMKIVEDSNE